MAHDMTPEQIEELKKISAMPKEQQKGALESFLKTLSPEQIKALQDMQQQGGQCIFCMIGEKKVESFTVYEDDFLIAVLNIRPGSKGQTIVFPKKHVQVFSQLSPEEQARLFLFTNSCAGVLYESLNCAGTSIVLNQGAAAGQAVPHIAFDIIPRFEGDGLNLAMTGEEGKKEDMQEILGKVVERLKEAVGKQAPVEEAFVPPVPADDAPVEEETVEITSGEKEEEPGLDDRIA